MEYGDITIWGPETWTENREDGIVKSIDVKIKGWTANNVPTKIKHSHIEDPDDHTKSLGTKAVEVLDYDVDADIEETFNWIVPDNLQTDKVWHAHKHPHDVENDIAYNEKAIEWLDLIQQEVKFQEAMSKINKHLGEM